MSESAAAAPRRRGEAALAWAAVALVVAVHGLLTWRWMRDHGFFARPPSHDASWYRLDAQLMLDALRRDGVVGWLKAGFDYDGSHPPMFLMAVAATAALGGATRLEPATLWPANFLFFAVLVFGAFRLARHFVGPRGAAFVGGVVACCPVNLCLLRPCEVQMPMAALVLWSLDALLRSDGLRRPGRAALSGFYAGLATLAKMLAPLYVAGALLAVFVAGVRRSETRGRTLRGAVAWSAAAIVVCATWYARHWRGVLGHADFVVGEEGQARFSGNAPIASLDRWLYYPRVLVDHGFGLPLAVAVIAAIIALCVRAARGRGGAENPPADGLSEAPRGFALAASVLVGWPIITVGTTAAFAMYPMSFVPLGVVALGAALAATPGRALRATAYALAAAAALWQAAQAYRPIYEDVDGPRYGGVAFFGQVDTQIAGAVRRAGGRDAPDAEPWPTREFAATMLRAVPHRKPRLAYVMNWENPFVSSANLRYEALGLGRDLSLAALTTVGTTDGPDALAALRAADFAVVTKQRLRRGPRRVTAEKLVAELGDSGVEARIVARAAPTAKSELALVEILWPKAVAVEPATEAALAHPAVRRTTAEFANGWKLLGVRDGRVGADAFVVTTYWAARATGSAEGEIEIAVLGATDARPWRVATNLAPPVGAAADAVVVAVTSGALPAAGRGEPAPAVRLIVREAGGASRNAAVVAAVGTGAADGAVALSTSASRPAGGK